MAYGIGLRWFPLALAFAVAGAQDAELAERLLRSGERAYAGKAYAEAVETWEQLIQQAPRAPQAAQALLKLAHHQLDTLKKPEGALPFLERIKAEHLKTPWAAEAMLLRGRILAERSRGPAEIREALAEFNRVVDLFPDHPLVQEARFQLGLAFAQQGQWGRALQNFIEAMRLDPASATARRAQLQAAETLDLLGDGPGCLRMLQGLRNRFPDSAESAEAAWRIQVRIKERVQKPPLTSQGPWPEGRQKWLKTPTLLATGPGGELYIFQDDLDRAFQLKDGQLQPAGPVAKGAKGMVVSGSGQVWLVSPKLGVVKDDSPAAPAAVAVSSPTGASRDAWGNVWVCDGRAVQVVAPDGTARALPAGAAVALAALPTGGAVAASDTAKALLFLDAEGQTVLTVPYGKDLPATFKYVVALASDPLGHVAALVDGDFEGVCVWGPDGALLRSATFKALGVAGKFRAIALDRQGGLILADRSNDLLIRID